MKALKIALGVFAISIATTIANAGDIQVLVTDSSGKPVPNAVVTLDLPGSPENRPGQFRVNQKDLEFHPYVLVIPVGSTVDFSNLDPVRHHVYSFSAAKKFDLKLFGKGESRSVRFDQPGVVAIGCNIHDSMQAFIHVSASPLAARTGPDGRVTLRGAPAGVHALHIWHAMMRAPGNEISQSVNTASNISLPFVIKLRRPAPMAHDY
jgi:plastocyanin